MLLTNALHLDYKHIENGDLYTLLYIGNVNCDQTILEESGLPKWEPRACYRNKETGEVFIRRLSEFESKFQLTFPALEDKLVHDFGLLENLDLLDQRNIIRRRITLLGIAKELWSLFPLVAEDARVGIIRALNFTDFVDAIPNAAEYFLTELGIKGHRLPFLFQEAGATLGGDGTNHKPTDFVKGADANNTLGLLMVGLACSLREYRFLRALSVEEAHVTEQLKKLEFLIESIQQTANWFGTVGITIALPNMEAIVNTFDPKHLTHSN